MLQCPHIVLAPYSPESSWRTALDSTPKSPIWQRLLSSLLLTAFPVRDDNGGALRPVQLQVLILPSALLRHPKHGDSSIVVPIAATKHGTPVDRLDRWSSNFQAG
ncbi:hypothetical protein CVT26_005506 [Gymnopilus dilepis]|uniref:Uncharacterized protein n=1 Tax=Gymnopilus dilepis TaxID=231916 RepID=A0A409WJM6_9AGAR|nr:hypothetical protein CVT26_005506 [Gymnopilus dilepis]